MVLPTKHLRPDRSLLGVGGQILGLLNRPKTVSALWDDLSQYREQAVPGAPVPFDWFVLALDMLFMVGAIAEKRGRIFKVQR